MKLSLLTLALLILPLSADDFIARLKAERTRREVETKEWYLEALKAAAKKESAPGSITEELIRTVFENWVFYPENNKAKRFRLLAGGAIHGAHDGGSWVVSGTKIIASCFGSTFKFDPYTLKGEEVRNGKTSVVKMVSERWP